MNWNLLDENSRFEIVSALKEENEVFYFASCCFLEK